MTLLEDLYSDWIQCENYDVLIKLNVCKGLDAIYRASHSFGISLFLDQWLVHILILLLIATLSVMLFASLTEEQMCLKEIRSKVGNNWCALLNLIYAVRLTQELAIRNESLRMDMKKRIFSAQIKTTQPIMTAKNESTKISPNPELKPKNSSATPKQTASSISQISPRTKKPKLDKDSGVESITLSDNESQNHLASREFNSMDLLEALRRNQSLDNSIDSDKLVAPPSSPVTSPSTPMSKASSMDTNISSSIKRGIFEKRKKFFEKSEFRNISPKKTKSESSSRSTTSSSSSSENCLKVRRFIERPAEVERH